MPTAAAPISLLLLVWFSRFYLATPTVAATQWVVGPENQGNDNSLGSVATLATVQEAVNRAAQNDRIGLQIGIHSGGENRAHPNPAFRKCSINVDLRGKALVLEGLGTSPDQTIVDCKLNSWPLKPTRAFIFQSGETNNTILRMLTIKRCRALKGIQTNACYGPNSWTHLPLSRGLMPSVPAHVGGAIAIINKSTPSLFDIKINGCKAGLGGGIYVNGHHGVTVSTASTASTASTTSTTGTLGNVMLHRVHISSSTSASGGAAVFVTGPSNVGTQWKVGTLTDNAIDPSAGIFESCHEARNANNNNQVTPGGIVQRFQKTGAGGFGHGTHQGSGKEFLFLASRGDQTVVYMRDVQDTEGEFVEIQSLDSLGGSNYVESWTIDDDFFVAAVESHKSLGNENTPGAGGESITRSKIVTPFNNWIYKFDSTSSRFVIHQTIDGVSNKLHHFNTSDGKQYLAVPHKYHTNSSQPNGWINDSNGCPSRNKYWYHTNSYIYELNKTTQQWENPMALPTLGAMDFATVSVNGVTWLAVGVAAGFPEADQVVPSQIIELTTRNDGAINGYLWKQNISTHTVYDVEACSFNGRHFFIFVNRHSVERVEVYELDQTTKVWKHVQRVHEGGFSAVSWSMDPDHHYLAVAHDADVRTYAFDDSCATYDGTALGYIPDYKSIHYVECPFKLYDIVVQTPSIGLWEIVLFLDMDINEDQGAQVSQNNEAGNNPLDKQGTLQYSVNGAVKKLYVEASLIHDKKFVKSLSIVVGSTTIATDKIKHISQSFNRGYPVTWEVHISSAALSTLTNELSGTTVIQSSDQGEKTTGILIKKSTGSIYIASELDVVFAPAKQLQIGTTTIVAGSVTKVTQSRSIPVVDSYYAGPGHYNRFGTLCTFSTGSFKSNLKKQYLGYTMANDAGSIIDSLLLDVSHRSPAMKLIHDIPFYRPRNALPFIIDNEQYVLLSTVAQIAKPLPVLKLSNVNDVSCSEMKSRISYLDSEKVSGSYLKCGNNEKVMDISKVGLGAARGQIHFTIGLRHFIALASSKNFNNYQLVVQIYEFNRQSKQFVLFQSLDSFHASDIKTMAMGSVVYIVLGQGVSDELGVFKNHQTRLFKYCEETNQFRPIQTLPAPILTSTEPLLTTFETTTSEGHVQYFIVESSDRNEDKSVAGVLYRFNAATQLFEHFQTLAHPHHGFAQIVAVHIHGSTYLVCLKSTGSTALTSPIYKQNKATGFFETHHELEKVCIGGGGVFADSWSIGGRTFLAVGCQLFFAGEKFGEVNIFQFERDRFKVWKTMKTKDVYGVKYFQNSNQQPTRHYLIITEHGYHKYKMYEIGIGIFDYPKVSAFQISSGGDVAKVVPFQTVPQKSSIKQAGCRDIVVSTFSSSVLLDSLTIRNDGSTGSHANEALVCVSTNNATGKILVLDLAVGSTSSKRNGLFVERSSTPSSIVVSNLRGTSVLDVTRQSLASDVDIPHRLCSKSSKFHYVRGLQCMLETNTIWYVADSLSSISSDLNSGTSIEGPLSTIQEAINRASDGDVVKLLQGIHSNVGTDCTSTDPAARRCNHNLDFQGKAIVVEGEGPLASDVVVTCGFTGNTWPTKETGPQRAFGFVNNETGTSVLRRLTLQNCRAMKGLRQSNCDPTGYNGQRLGVSSSDNPTCRSRGLFDTIPNHAGAGIAIVNASPTLENLIIKNMRAGIGAALYIGENAAPSLNNIQVDGCVAAAGSAVTIVDAKQVSWDRGTINENNVVTHSQDLGPYETCEQALATASKDTPGGVFQAVQTNSASSWCSFTVTSSTGEKGYLIVDNQKGTESILYEFIPGEEFFKPILEIPHQPSRHLTRGFNFAHIQVKDNSQILLYTQLNQDVIPVYSFVVAPVYKSNINCNPANNGLCSSTSNAIWTLQNIDLNNVFDTTMTEQRCVCNEDGTIGDGSPFALRSCEGLLYKRSTNDDVNYNNKLRWTFTINTGTEMVAAKHVDVMQTVSGIVSTGKLDVALTGDSTKTIVVTSAADQTFVGGGSRSLH